jgi:hypothetical protein
LIELFVIFKCNCLFSDSSSGPYRREMDTLNTRLRYVEVQLTEARTELATKTSALQRAEAELEQNKRTAVSFETSLSRAKQVCV